MQKNMKVIFNVAGTREPVRTYQLEHRSGSRINIVEDGLEDTKCLAKKHGLTKLSVLNNQLPQVASSANGSKATINATMKAIMTVFIVIGITIV